MLGVQLWSVNEALQRDFGGTLRALADLGFRRVEGAGWLGHGPDAFRRAIDSAGMHCDSAHFGMDALVADAHGAVAQARDAGCEYLVCASPWVPGPLPAGIDWVTAVIQIMTRDAWKRTAELLNQAGAAAASAGLRFAYHNHVAEFVRYQGERGYDTLLANTDPASVKLEVDIAWVAAGGQDPVALIDTHRARIVRLHLKDVKLLPRPNEVATSFLTAPPGSGVLDWTPILRAARSAGIPAAYLEAEAPYLRSPLQDLAAGRAHIARVLAGI